ncbi:MAG TPA: 3-hydroxyacyl-CoA dehydrogenase NAD-binding domain-containing protein [Chloroflexota bacterium]
MGYDAPSVKLSPAERGDRGKMEASEIERTLVVGGGLMGTGLAQIMGQAGCHVWVVDVTSQQLERSAQRLRASLDTFVDHDLLTREQADGVLGRVAFTTSMEEAARDVQLAVEAVVEELPVKQAIFEQLGRLAPREAILATNTSGLSVGDIAARCAHPERVVGSHFFYPHTVVPLVEVGYGRETGDAAIETAVAFWKRCGKEPVICRKDSRGFIVNRMQSAIAREATSLVSNGVASISDVDKALRLGIGVRLALTGTLEQRDWGGIDVHFEAAKSIYPTLETTITPLPFVADRVARGHIGAKAGKGFYDWTGKDVEGLRRKKQEQLIALLAAIKQIVPDEEELIENNDY